MTISAWGDKETKYFYELTPERILDAVEAFGFRATGRCMPLNSMENRVYEVEIELEEGVTVKSPSERFRIVKFYRPGRWSKEQILEEHKFLLDLVEYEIPAVAPLQINGETLLTIPEIQIFAAVFPKIGGRSPDELDDQQMARVGRLLARMHGVGSAGTAPHRLEINTDTYGLANLEYLLSNSHLPQDVSATYSQVVREICALSEPLFRNATNHRIHGDCHLGNLLWNDEGPFWVDFDDMLRGPAVQDLWLIIPGRDEYAIRKRDILVNAYEEMRSFDRSALQLIEPLRALRFIHFSGWIARRWDDPAFKQAFSHFGTGRYWQDQVQDLREQLDLIREGTY